MKSLLGLIALILIFFVLAFFIGFGEISSDAEGSTIRLGPLSLSLPTEAIFALREQVAGVAALFHALPAPVSEALQAVADALGDLYGVFGYARQYDERTAPPEGAFLVWGRSHIRPAAPVKREHR